MSRMVKPMKRKMQASRSSSSVLSVKMSSGERTGADAAVGAQEAAQRPHEPHENPQQEATAQAARSSSVLLGDLGELVAASMNVSMDQGPAEGEHGSDRAIDRDPGGSRELIRNTSSGRVSFRNTVSVKLVSDDGSQLEEYELPLANSRSTTASRSDYLDSLF
ncbi:hypothetical protein FVE85_7329 [Porphyridium purpureum]|uniref:Uncharacterized protein n=1 Tax=Porphyridium purpureum TaxID=35688 RepID=A0A5J4Z9R5_PORPP|nr:hypothetical protein FVE85_7329 [Porphyridium purpureum]|eukprot:POR6390..scf295_1